MDDLYEWALSKIDERNPNAVLLDGMGKALAGFAAFRDRRVAIYSRRRLFNILLETGLEPRSVIATVEIWDRRDHGKFGPIIADVWEDLNEQISMER